MKRTFVAILAAAAVLAPTAAIAQETDQARETDQVREADQVRDGDQVRDREVDRDFDDVKERALEAIAKRVEALSNAIGRIEANEHVEPDHARALIEDYEFHIAGLERLVEPIEEAETPEELKPLVESIVVEHWVFALQIPKGKLTVAADSTVDATEHFSGVFERIENVLAQLSERGIELPEAEQLLDEAERLTAAAAETAGAIPAVVLAIQVEEMPEARSVLEAAHEDLRGAHGNLVDARENVHQIIRIIKDAVGSDEARSDAPADASSDA